MNDSLFCPIQSFIAMDDSLLDSTTELPLEEDMQQCDKGEIDVLALGYGYLNFSCSFHNQLWKGLEKISVDVPDIQGYRPESWG